MSDLRIKHWGLFPITRRGYLLGQALVLLAWIALFWVNWRLPRPYPSLPSDTEVITRGLVHCLQWLPWILTAVAVWWPIDMFFMLRRFRQLEGPKPTSSGS